ncbi:MAG: 3'-5' exonuclease [Bacillota bacterium]
MAYIVLDMEWNQNGIDQKCPINKQGKQLHDEIIQIGAVRLDDALRISDTFKVGVRLPKKRKLTRYVAKVVRISQSEINGGIDFPDAVKLFREWCGRAPVFLTWGYDDIPVLRRNLEYYGINADWTARWYNAQMVFSWQHLGEKRQMSLEGAATHLGVMGEEPLHDALNDAFYTALICANLDMEGGLAVYEEYTRPSLKNAPRKRRLRSAKKAAPAFCEADAQASIGG